MRIAHLSTRMSLYGGEVCLANLARELSDRGHEVSCLVRPYSALEAQFAGTGVQLVKQKMIDWYDVRTIRRIRSWLRANPVDILASHTPRDHFIAAVASCGLGVCNVATRHQLKPLSYPWLKRPFLRNFGAVVGVSDAVSRVVRETRWLPSERVATVLNGIQDPQRRRRRHFVRNHLGLGPEVPLVGMVGKMCAEKGGEVLLRAAAVVARRLSAFQLVLVGDGDDDYQNHLRALVGRLEIGGLVHFMDYIPRVAEVIHEFDVLVVASTAEPFGLVTVEAMASSVPVVATNSGGTPEIISDGREGFLIRPGDVGELANRLSCLLASAGLRWEMGVRGRQRFLSEFTLNRMMDQTEAVYRRALLQTHSSPR